MRIPFDDQLRFDCPAIDQVPLNTNCRDEWIPILRGLQHIYSQPETRDAILSEIARDVNGTSSARHGRPGMSYWQILVLAAVRLGCNLDYDKLQDLAENHRRLRQIMGIGDWDDHDGFDWRRIWENLCHLSPETVEKINHHLVAAGHQLVPEAPKSVRGDAFVAETNIHYPTDSSLAVDGLTHILELAAALAKLLDIGGWRQHKHLLKKARKLARQIRRIAAKKGPNYRERLQCPYGALLNHTKRILDRASALLDETYRRLDAGTAPTETLYFLGELTYFVATTQHACEQARRRVIEGESVPNDQKIFSIFEPDTELIKRGKTPDPIQFGHRVLLFEDAAGFICHYAVLPNGIEERAVGIEHLKRLQDRLGGAIERASLDKGFHSPANQTEIANIVKHPCLPTTAKEAPAEAGIEFRKSRQRHPGVESAIGALQAGNGLERSRDRSRPGFERYIGLGVLGRNLHVLGKLLIAQELPACQSAKSKRKPAA